MRSLTSIQITPEEDHQISVLKKKLGLPTKKAVVLEGIRSLQQVIVLNERSRRLQGASFKVRKGSKSINQEWSRSSSALKTK